MTNEEKMAGFTSKPYFSKPKSCRATDHIIHNTPRYFFVGICFPSKYRYQKDTKVSQIQKVSSILINSSPIQ